MPTYISAKPKVNKGLFISGSLLIWAGALLPSKFEPLWIVAVGALCAVIGSIIMMFASSHVWTQKSTGQSKNGGTYVEVPDK